MGVRIEACWLGDGKDIGLVNNLLLWFPETKGFISGRLVVVDQHIH